MDVIWNPPGLDPKFIDLGSLTWETIENLKPYHEQWVGGIELVPTSAYGIRLYQNESTLVMHYDRVLIRPHLLSKNACANNSRIYLTIRFKRTSSPQLSMLPMSMTMRMSLGRSK